MLFCIDHPFEGMNVVRYPCMTEEIERRLFGEQLCFMYDDADTRNRPVRGIHSNAITMWNLLPDVLKDSFKQEFAKAKLDAPETRMTEMQWIDVFTGIRDSLVKCPLCGDESFLEEQVWYVSIATAGEHQQQKCGWRPKAVLFRFSITTSCVWVKAMP